MRAATMARCVLLVALLKLLMMSSMSGIVMATSVAPRDNDGNGDDAGNTVEDFAAWPDDKPASMGEEDTHAQNAAVANVASASPSPTAHGDGRNGNVKEEEQKHSTDAPSPTPAPAPAHTPDHGQQGVEVLSARAWIHACVLC